MFVTESWTTLEYIVKIEKYTRTRINTLCDI